MTICWTVPVGNGAGGGRDPGSIPTGSTLCEHSQRCSASPFIEADSFVSVMPGPGGMIPQMMTAADSLRMKSGAGGCCKMQ
jgi:hypothetical protein